MIKEKNLEQLDRLIDLLKRNVKKIDKRLSNCLLKQEPNNYGFKVVEKKKPVINNKSN